MMLHYVLLLKQRILTAVVKDHYRCTTLRKQYFRGWLNCMCNLDFNSTWQ